MGLFVVFDVPNYSVINFVFLFLETVSLRRGGSVKKRKSFIKRSGDRAIKALSTSLGLLKVKYIERFWFSITEEFPI